MEATQFSSPAPLQQPCRGGSQPCPVSIPRAEPDALQEACPVVAIFLSGEGVAVRGVSCGSFVGHVRQRLVHVRPLPPGSDYRLVFGGRVLHDLERLPDFTVFAVVDGEDALEQRVRELLDQVSSDNLQVIVDLLAEIVPSDARELKKIIDVIIGKVFRNPHGCEMYAKIVYFLSTRYPELPLDEDEQPATFRRVLLKTCQREFEASLASLELPIQETEGLDPQEISFEQSRRKSRLLAIVKFVGHLFVGNVKFIDLVARELIGHQRDPHCRLQEEQKAECVLELIQVVGNKIDRRRDGKVLIRKFITWLLDRQAFFSSRVQLRIQGLVGLSSCDA